MVDQADNKWLAVIGKTLAYLCLQEAQRKDPGKFGTVAQRVEFLEGFGLSLDDAAAAAGTSAASVRELRRQARAGGKNRGKKGR